MSKLSMPTERQEETFIGAVSCAQQGDLEKRECNEPRLERKPLDTCCETLTRNPDPVTSSKFEHSPSGNKCPSSRPSPKAQVKYSLKHCGRPRCRLPHTMPIFRASGGGSLCDLWLCHNDDWHPGFRNHASGSDS